MRLVFICTFLHVRVSCSFRRTRTCLSYIRINDSIGFDLRPVNGLVSHIPQMTGILTLDLEIV